MEHNKAYIPERGPEKGPLFFYFKEYPQKIFLLIIRSAFLFAAILLLSMQANYVYGAGTDGISPAKQAAVESRSVPSGYGETIYRYNERSPYQLYIVGTSHRNSITRANGGATARAQAEVYKIGEWLIREGGLELLLPEGFFSKRGEVKGESPVVNVETKVVTPLLDILSLEKRLADDSLYINAEMLLRENYPVRVRQVEDRVCYEDVRKCLLLMDEPGDDRDTLSQRLELDFLQEMRTAIMLQKVPALVNEEFREGRIRGKRALFTIGLAHIQLIIRWLEERKILISSPLFSSMGNRDYSAEPDLIKEGFGVTIIIPRTLADDRETLKITGLGGLPVQRADGAEVLSTVALP